MRISTGRCSSRPFISAALCPRITMIFAAEVFLKAPTILSMNVSPLIGSSALGCPMRLDSPAARTTAAIIERVAGVHGHKSPLTPPFDLAQGGLFQRGEKLPPGKYPPLAKGDLGGFYGAVGSCRV